MHILTFFVFVCTRDKAVGLFWKKCDAVMTEIMMYAYITQPPSLLQTTPHDFRNGSGTDFVAIFG